ncbi:DNA damage response protein RcaA [Verticillium alfalfae VaMs.102]|uniref:DNA damage response protein RcaA n=1 Tax=Verticillium alfalfae (strain VaMs.102 / ATCC MYA-4576 / FGSC 10136) TaxID=526221 RepID=C9SQR4_VERA1|nr:DNA damage response protein RcaA [Verticillium alfalfae VaMs.102]EEY21189.1 DNA damage response protein RcaA [Verticillium alfalfae VaMs.102]
MWLLEQENVFEGRQLWLRPGKLYLFGRTASEPGQLAISHKTISRKHMTIKIEPVADGRSQSISKRSTVTIEDLATKTGTTIDGEKYKGDKHVVSNNVAEIKLGGCPDIFRLSWHPVVLSFSFTSREMREDPARRLRDMLEQLDIKFTFDYNIQHTTHVVAKKRNTSKGLQALINGRYIVTDSFVDAIVAAALPPDGAEATEASALEQDFQASWPNPLEHLPPRGGEPVERPPDAYAPDEARKEIFEGYTFIFYDRNQYDNLLAPITNGGGKALHTEVTPEKTTVDDFVLFVKTEAGEKGLGSFEDGSEGRGVVVVRFTPDKGDHTEWYASFFYETSLRLDHRPIEQNEFLEAILAKDASILRRPLQTETVQDSPPRAARNQAATKGGDAMETDPAPAPDAPSQDISESSIPGPRRGRTRRQATRRFAGFDDDSDDDDKGNVPQASMPNTRASGPAEEAEDEDEEEGLFVSQDRREEAPATRSQRKRPAPDSADLMDGLIPTAAAAKRRRIEAGEDPIRRQSPDEPEEPAQPKPAPKKVKREIDVLEEARKRREEMEARAKAERDDLANVPSDIDLDAIRRLHIVEEMELRKPGGDARASRTLPTDAMKKRPSRRRWLRAAPVTRIRGTRSTATESLSTGPTSSRSQATGRTTQGKRPAAEASSEPPAKRPRPVRQIVEVRDSDESDDELKFKFGRRR